MNIRAPVATPPFKTPISLALGNSGTSGHQKWPSKGASGAKGLRYLAIDDPRQSCRQPNTLKRAPSQILRSNNVSVLGGGYSDEP
jgi:hypothetical protein